MNISVDKSGKAKVTLFKREVKTLTDAANLLVTLGKHADSEESTEASEAVFRVLSEFNGEPVSKEDL